MNHFRVSLALVLALGAMGTGCLEVRYAPRHGGPDGAEAAIAQPAGHVEPSIWPARVRVESGLKAETLKELKPVGAGEEWGPRGMIVPVTPPVVAHRWEVKGNEAMAKAEQDADAKLLRGAVKEEFSKETMVGVVGEGEGAFIFSAPVKSPSDDPLAQSPLRATFMFRFMSLRPPAKGSLTVGQGATTPIAAMRMERTWFSYYDPFPPKDANGLIDGNATPVARGVVVLLPGMFGTPTDQVSAMVRRLRNEGWAVVRMLAHPSRFTEKTVYMMPVEGDMSEGARQIAAELGDRAAECAYAVEGAMLYVLQERPALRGKPRVAMGMSGGAMALPTVVAKDPDAWAAAVFIGGGVDFLKILTLSNYVDFIDAVRVKWFRPGGEDGAKKVKAVVSRERMEELWGQYRGLCALDSTCTVSALAGKPVLILQAKNDLAVPAETSDRMWEMLGKPDRWMVDGGHEWLFWTLSNQTGKMMDWLDAHVPGAGKVESPAKIETGK